MILAAVPVGESSSSLTPLGSALLSNNQEIVELLLDAGSDVHLGSRRWNITRLSYACKKANVGTVKMLLEKGAEINCQYSSGTTPLLEASRRGNLEIVELLLENGADQSVRNSRNLSPFSSALYEGCFSHEQIVGKETRRRLY